MTLAAKQGQKLILFYNHLDKRQHVQPMRLCFYGAADWLKGHSKARTLLWLFQQAGSGSIRLCFALLYEVPCYSSCIAVVLQLCTSSVRCREIKAHGLKMLGPPQACSRCPCSLLSSRAAICCRTCHGFKGLERPWHLWLVVSQYAQCQMRYSSCLSNMSSFPISGNSISSKHYPASNHSASACCCSDICSISFGATRLSAGLHSSV